MSEPFMGQIITTGFAYAPTGYAQCDGQLMPVPQYNALFALLGVMYGGDGRATFGLPDLRGRYPLGGFPSVDAGWQPPIPIQGSPQGVETVTLLEAQIPPHTHIMGVSSLAGVDGAPANQVFAVSSGNTYAQPANLVPLSGGPLSPTESGAHSNIQPSLVVNFAIALTGVWPSRQ